MAGEQLLILLLANVQLLLNATWISAKSKIPYNVSEFAVGSYNNTIFIVGGTQKNNLQRIIEYQISTDAFIDLGDILTDHIRGEAQFWVQKEEILYIIKPSGTRISTFNMKTRQYTATMGIIINKTVHNGGCLASSNDHLFIVGGTSSDNSNDGFDTLQILSIETNEWIQNAPSMQQNRTDHACIAHKDILWVFGGLNIKALKTNEYIEINNITQNVWEYIAPLTDDHEAIGLRVIAFEDDIYIIGGKSKTTGVVHDTIHVYNVITRTMTLSDDRLPYGVRYMGSIMVHNVMYLFGGYRPCEPCDTGYGITNQWMYNAMLSAAPSKSSIDPSNSPSQTPTRHQTDSTFTISTTSSAQSSSATLHPSVTSSTTGDISTNGSHLILFIAGGIAAFCVFCFCVFVLWKVRTQKRWDPDPHDTAGNGAQQRAVEYIEDVDDDSEQQEDEPQIVDNKRKREKSVSVCDTITDMITIGEEPQNVRQGEVDDKIEDVKRKRIANVEGLSIDTTTTNIQTGRALQE